MSEAQGDILYICCLQKLKQVFFWHRLQQQPTSRVHRQGKNLKRSNLSTCSIMKCFIVRPVCFSLWALNRVISCMATTIQRCSSKHYITKGRHIVHTFKKLKLENVCSNNELMVTSVYTDINITHHTIIIIIILLVRQKGGYFQSLEAELSVLTADGKRKIEKLSINQISIDLLTNRQIISALNGISFVFY